MEPAIVLGFRQPPVVVSYWGFLPSGVFSVLCSHLERKVGARERESVRFNPIGGYTDDEYEQLSMRKGHRSCAILPRGAL